MSWNDSADNRVGALRPLALGEAGKAKVRADRCTISEYFAGFQSAGKRTLL
jgi:hypothetical protein